MNPHNKPPAYSFTGAYGNPPPYTANTGNFNSYQGAPYQKNAYSYAPQQLPRHHMNQPPPGISHELWEWFKAVDADGNGQITASELERALMNGNWTPFNPETCRLMVGMFDADRNGTIDIHEFAGLWKYIQDWKACFDSFDRDRSGTIDTGELNLAFQTFGYNLSMNFCNLCVRVFDRSDQSSMKFDDFIQCCVMLKVLSSKFMEKDLNRTGTIRIYYEEFLKMALDNTIV